MNDLVCVTRSFSMDRGTPKYVLQAALEHALHRSPWRTLTDAEGTAWYKLKDGTYRADAWCHMDPKTRQLFPAEHPASQAAIRKDRQSGGMIEPVAYGEIEHLEGVGQARGVA